MSTKESILKHTSRILAKEGVAGTSMRKVAAAVGIEASVIYSHFPNKLALLRATREYTTMQLAIEMQQVRHDGTALGRLRAMLEYQMRARGSIIALLQYFMVIREDFVRVDDGYVPSRAYQHLTEIISLGVSEGIFITDDIEFDAKAMNHLISGFLMEYFEHEIDDDHLERIVDKIQNLIVRALSPKGGR